MPVTATAPCTSLKVMVAAGSAAADDDDDDTDDVLVDDDVEGEVTAAPVVETPSLVTAAMSSAWSCSL